MLTIRKKEILLLLYFSFGKKQSKMLRLNHCNYFEADSCWIFTIVGLLPDLMIKKVTGDSYYGLIRIVLVILRGEIHK